MLADVLEEVESRPTYDLFELRETALTDLSLISGRTLPASYYYFTSTNDLLRRPALALGTLLVLEV